MRKIWIYIPVGIISILLLWQIFFKSDATNLELVTQKIEPGEVSDIISATGTLKALNTVDVGTQVSGVIDEIYTDFNESVKKGQLIAKLDMRTLSANLADASSALQKARLQAAQTGTVFDRSKKLMEESLISQEEFDRTKYEYEAAQLNVETAKTSLERAQVNLGYASIVSPVNGIVISRNIEKGQTVAAAFTTPTLFTIAADLKEMVIEADIDEADIGKVKTGQAVEFFVDAFPDEYFTGTVKQIRLQPKTIQNVVNYSVVIGVSNPDMKLFPGMTANLSIVAEKRTNVLIVPSAALNYI
ncbi:MAG: efflux RND transporter periplasmic adaptor subunit, partial [Flavobacteriales bacterium]